MIFNLQIQWSAPWYYNPTNGPSCCPNAPITECWGVDGYLSGGHGAGYMSRCGCGGGGAPTEDAPLHGWCAASVPYLATSSFLPPPCPPVAAPCHCDQQDGEHSALHHCNYYSFFSTSPSTLCRAPFSALLCKYCCTLGELLQRESHCSETLNVAGHMWSQPSSDSSVVIIIILNIRDTATMQSMTIMWHILSEIAVVDALNQRNTFIYCLPATLTLYLTPLSL